MEKEGQAAMTTSFMYSPLNSMSPPEGAPELAKVLKKSFPWNKDFLKTVTAKRGDLKETYTEIMFQ